MDNKKGWNRELRCYEPSCTNNVHTRDELGYGIWGERLLNCVSAEHLSGRLIRKNGREKPWIIYYFSQFLLAK